MKPVAIVLLATACFSGVTLAATPFTSLHPEEAYPSDAAPITSGVFEDMLKQVQEKLNANGFDAGPANGTVNSKTQAALAQFQISQNLPVSGALDDVTLATLGVQRSATAAPAEEQTPVVADKPGEEPGPAAANKPSEEQGPAAANKDAGHPFQPKPE